MKAITLKHMRYFDALARAGHFGRAADILAISQPALSVQIKDLEDILGAPLLERGPRQITLTRLGQEFLRRTTGILQEVDELGDMVRAAKGPMSGSLRIGVIPTIAPYMLPDLIRVIGNNYPALDIVPREAITAKLIADLLEGRLDLALVALPISEPALHEEALFDEEFVLVRHKAEAKKPVPNARKLHEMRLLLLEEGHCFRDQALSFCDLSPNVSRDLMEGSSLSTLVQMVGANIGVTLIPEMAVRLESRVTDVAVAHFPAPAPKREIGLVWRKTSPLAADFVTLGRLIGQNQATQREADASSLSHM